MTFDRTARESSLIMAASIVASFISPSQAHGQVLRLVSSPPVYHPVNHHGDRPSMSADGRYVAFASTNALVPDDVTDVYLDIYLKDLITNDVQRISVNSSGEAANNHSSRPCLSPDGRYIAFESLATNLVADDTNNAPDIFIYDRQTGITERVSLSSNEEQSNGLSYEANLSEDGRFVAFTSEATNLDPSVSSVGEQVYLRDRLLGTTEIISMDPDAPAMHQFTAFRPTMSYDGRFVAFTATTRYELDDVNGLADVFLRDRQTGTLTRVSKGDASLGLNGDGAFLQTISADGRFVAFLGFGGHIEGDTNGFGDIFVKDLNTNVIERLSVDSNGNQSIGGFSHDAVISANGRFVVPCPRFMYQPL